MDALATLSQAKAMLANCASIDGAKAIRDKASAIAAYLRQQGESFEAQNSAAEIRLRAERRLGELLAEQEKNLGAAAKRGNKPLPRLEELGIEKMQSHRWQRIASIPDAEFESYIATSKDDKRELTQAAVLKLAKSEPKQGEQLDFVTDEMQSESHHVISDLASIAGRKYGTIYADPPWRYDNSATRSAVESIYEGTMSVAEICNLPVGDLAADDAHCHLWTTNAFLPFAFQVLEEWGFEYRSVFVWVKPQMGIGNYWRVSHEFMLLGIRGNAKRFNERCHKSWMELDRTQHSEKPYEIRQIIEKVSPGPFLELFGRKPVSGWTVFGNQIESRLFV